jgi:hypothetical protein
MHGIWNIVTKSLILLLPHSITQSLYLTALAQLFIVNNMAVLCYSILRAVSCRGQEFSEE